MMRFLAAALLVFFAVRCDAAASWFSVANHDWGDESGISIYYYGFATPEVGFVATRDWHGDLEKLTPSISYVNCGNSAAYWMLAYAGEEIGNSLMRNADLVLDAFYTNPSGHTEGDPLYVFDGDSFYLALIGNDGIAGAGSEYTAWVEVGVNGSTLEVLDDELSYGTLTVGQHPYTPPSPPITPTPEPTSGLLLLVGSAMLLIRRQMT